LGHGTAVEEGGKLTEWAPLGEPKSVTRMLSVSEDNPEYKVPPLRRIFVAPSLSKRRLFSSSTVVIHTTSVPV